MFVVIWRVLYIFRCWQVCTLQETATLTLTLWLWLWLLGLVCTVPRSTTQPQSPLSTQPLMASGMSRLLMEQSVQIALLIQQVCTWTFVFHLHIWSQMRDYWFFLETWQLFIFSALNCGPIVGKNGLSVLFFHWNLLFYRMLFTHVTTRECDKELVHCSPYILVFGFRQRAKSSQILGYTSFITTRPNVLLAYRKL